MKYFIEQQTVSIPSRGCRVTQYRHDSGAKLVHFRTDTPERAFCAAFRTVPWDSTGVFHILEHSCLSGSKKYPISSPILYMMNHSMQTYLNALTFQGKTLYPCASCHPGDFENLMRVYLDAVFHPNLTKETFLREGWHLEGENVKGVVYSEMQGALSSLDTRMYNAMKADLYPDTYQRYNSGGDPANIIGLQYEDFLRAYREHYSADNCVLFLQGDFEPEEYEQLLHETLDSVSAGGKARPYTLQAAHCTVRTHSYPISAGEETSGRAGLVFSYNIGNFEQSHRIFAAWLLLEYLMDNQNSPLLRALLATGLAQDAQYKLSQERQSALAIVLYNTEPWHRETFATVIERAIRGIIEPGIDRGALRAQLAAMAFRMKESTLAVQGRALEDFAAISNNLFFGLPLETGLDTDEILDFLERALETDYYENLLRELFLENPITACSVLEPREETPHFPQLTEEEKAKATTSGQPSLPDREEDLEKMPSLTREDLAVELRGKPFAVDGRMMYTAVETAGIVYLRYYFSMQGLNAEECMAAKLLSDCLAQLSTQERSAEKLSHAIKSTIGQLNFYPTTITRSCERADAYFMVTVSCLEKNLSAARALVSEILTKTLYSKEEIPYVIGSAYSGLRRSFAQNGMSIAQNRAAAAQFLDSRYHDLFGGYEYLSYLKRCSECPEDFCQTAASLARTLFCDRRLSYIGITCGGRPQADLELPLGQAPTAGAVELCRGNAAYAVASGVSYNAIAVRYDDLVPYSGKLLVMTKLLSRGFLWHQIREKGGAYGTFLWAARNGKLVASSYRDPQVENTFRAFRQLADYAENHVWTERELLGGQISVTADLINPQTPANEGINNEIRCLTGYTHTQRQRVLEEVCSFQTEDIKSFVPVFCRLAEEGAVCSVGNGEKLTQSKLFQEIISVS